MIEPLSLDMVADDRLAGFRLQRLEIFNWGTFDGRVWILCPNGKTSLLTGDIGSGKSTLVDAVTTLLVPSNNIVYNKAAGAENRERTLRSYVLGYFKSERQEIFGHAKPVALRDINTYSVLLGVFFNASYHKTVTLAQVFWMHDPAAQPTKLYTICERGLSIATDFSGFGSEISGLRKKLRARGDVELFDAFAPYGAQFRRLFGIENKQALELFHQTVSLKSVGNLTDFVRSHMLEHPTMAQRIDALLQHFDDLNRAHTAVVAARQQISMLEPLVHNCDRHTELTRIEADLCACREALRPWFAALKGQLLKKRLDTLREDHLVHVKAIERLEEKRCTQQARERELQNAIAENGGDRIERLAAAIRSSKDELERRQQKYARYEKLMHTLAVPPSTTEESFLQQRAALVALREDAEETETSVQNAFTEASVLLTQQRSEHDTITKEIASLKSRRSNIDDRQIALRETLCQKLGLPESDMPFVGELLQVREEERPWEGAIERLLHSFGLSLLVPDRHYLHVAAWVDRTDLRGRLIYFRIRDKIRREYKEVHTHSLAHKLQIKPGSVFFDWLHSEISHRFDLVCCELQEDFRRETRAITLTGQIKGQGERHEKDDRHRLDDRRHYVLGWSNAEKIAALEKEAQQQQERIARTATSISALQKQQTYLKNRLSTLSKVDEYQDFRDLNWQAVVLEVDRLETEKRDLEAASSQLQMLSVQLSTLKTQLGETEKLLDERKDKRSRTEQNISTAENLHQQVRVLLAATPDIVTEKFVILESMREEALGTQTLSVESCDNSEYDMRGWLQSKIGEEAQKRTSLNEKIIRAMTEYKKEWPLQTQDVDIHINAGFEFATMLQHLQNDDLPRFEVRFKELLNENTIREVANFQSQLNREKDLIKDRIARINASLTRIEYNPGRYITLEAQNCLDAEIRDFQQELRACTEGAMSGSDDVQYSEDKFLRVKNIIERFRGREASLDMDRRWTAKVTDVRNWFAFAASERWHEDNTEHEHYADSGGKSGGQKEKLAYTVLAASLAYQFGLDLNKVSSRSFRFVVIDEAFGRGSDESAQYGLRLFEQLNLQLLIVTPLQKIHIIEPFVASVGFVCTDDSGRSVLRNLSIAEYHEEKRQAQQ